MRALIGAGRVSYGNVGFMCACWQVTRLKYIVLFEGLILQLACKGDSASTYSGLALALLVLHYL